MITRRAHYALHGRVTPSLACLVLGPSQVKLSRFQLASLLFLSTCGLAAGLFDDEPGPPPQLADGVYVPLPARPRKLAVTVNTTNRAEVVNLFQTVYRASEGVAIGWNGDRASCTAGTNAQAYDGATVLRVNYFRAMAGLPADVTLTNLWNSQCMEAALMMSKQGQLSHSPDTSWACYTATGAQAAGKSNLYLGREGPPAIDGYIDDPGSNNYFVGRRRWILYPPQRVMGTGSIPGTGGWAANSLWVIGGFGSRPSQPAWVAWPRQRIPRNGQPLDEPAILQTPEVTFTGTQGLVKVQDPACSVR